MQQRLLSHRPLEVTPAPDQDRLQTKPNQTLPCEAYYPSQSRDRRISLVVGGRNKTGGTSRWKTERLYNKQGSDVLPTVSTPSSRLLVGAGFDTAIETAGKSEGRLARPSC